jgi:bifunctional DNA-binding transcriptional regulator/antitoxin component of YhaV-PrlF toxin-antitoxin module
MTDETVVTSKGTSTIPLEIRRKTGIGTGTIIQWSLEPDGRIVVRKKPGELNETQRHIRARAGAWAGAVSGVELLRRTRP